MKTKFWAVVLILFTTLLTSSAQILWKKGSENLSFNPLSILTNWYIIAGLMLYGVGVVLLILSFRGGEVSTLYPILAASYIWVTFLSIGLLKESINFFKSFGISAIIIGVIIINYGGSKH